MTLYLLQSLRNAMKEYFYTKEEINQMSLDFDIGSFTDLQTLINNATAPSGQTPVIILDKDYKYDSTTDSSLTNGITISKNITIIGNGHIIDGNSTKAFYIYGQYTFNLFDVRIQNCSTTGGAPIYARSSATVNINNTQFNQNTATGSTAVGIYGYGGAIYIRDNCNLTITNCTFNQNTVEYGFGGAIYTRDNCNLTITNCTFTNNNANDGYGGAIYVEDATVNINNTTFTQNNATGYDYKGGAINAWSGTININNTLFINNTATKNGGAIYAQDLQMTIKESVIKNNTAPSYANIYNDIDTTVYNCDINDISTTCFRITNKNYLTE